MMKNWKIGKRISAGFIMVIAITLALGAFAYNRTLKIEKNQVIVAKNYIPSVDALSHVGRNVLRIEALMVQHAQSNGSQQKDAFEAQIKDLRSTNEEAFAAYEALFADATEKDLYATVQANKATFFKQWDEVRTHSRAGSDAESKIAQGLVESELRPTAAKYEDSLQDVVDYDITECQIGLDYIEVAVTAAKHGVLIGVALAILIAIPIAYLVVKSITKPLAMTVELIKKIEVCDLSGSLDIESGDEMGQMAKALNTALETLRTTLHEVTVSAKSANASSQELSAATAAIAGGAQEQAASLEETSASLEEITATIRQSADNAKQANQLASASKESAEKGEGVVSQAIAAMEDINVASAKISDIISTIDEIAFQTNLLAVNAAVEAARAGEEGRGFAVVATEVRSLAQRSAEAAKEIKALIQDTLGKVEKGSELVNRSGETLQTIMTSVKQVTDIVGEIAAASEEQSTGVDQVNTAVTQIDQVTQTNSAQTEELSSTAQSLSDQSARLLKLVAIFTLSQDSEEPTVRAEPELQRVIPVQPPSRPVKRQPAKARKPAPRADLHVRGSDLKVPVTLLTSQPHDKAAVDTGLEK